MFRSKHGVHPLYGLRSLRDVAGLAHGFDANGLWKRVGFHSRVRRTPSVWRLLLAGAAVLAFVKLSSLAHRPTRSTARKVVLATLVLAVSAVVLALRKSARRYR